MHTCRLLTMLVIFPYTDDMARKRLCVNIADAKARLPELIERAANGEEIVLARHGKPRARLVPFVTRKVFVRGAGRGKWKGADDVLGRTLPDDLIAAFYGGTSATPDRDGE